MGTANSEQDQITVMFAKIEAELGQDAGTDSHFDDSHFDNDGSDVP